MAYLADSRLSVFSLKNARRSYISTTDPRFKSHFYITKNKISLFNKLAYKSLQAIRKFFQQSY